MGLWTSMSRYGAAKFSWNRAELTSTESIQMIGWKLLIHWFAKGFVFFFSPLWYQFFFLYWIILTKFLPLLWEKALLSLCWLFFLSIQKTEWPWDHID
jgi:hypothetical protein